jgi:NADH-quinone oxidoreductase subunit A
VPAIRDYGIVVILILAVMGIAAIILLLTYLIGPQRSGPVKHSVYESGVDPTGEARKRFNVRFYLVAVLFLIFDVEIVFLYPWAVLFPRLRAGALEWETARQAGENAATSPLANWAGPLADAGFTPTFLAAGVGIFFLLLTIGFVYEWRKGVFRWD